MLFLLVLYWGWIIFFMERLMICMILLCCLLKDKDISDVLWVLEWGLYLYLKLKSIDVIIYYLVFGVYDMFN